MLNLHFNFVKSASPLARRYAINGVITIIKYSIWPL